MNLKSGYFGKPQKNGYFRNNKRMMGSGESQNGYLVFKTTTTTKKSGLKVHSPWLSSSSTFGSLLIKSINMD